MWAVCGKSAVSESVHVTCADCNPANAVMLDGAGIAGAGADDEPEAPELPVPPDAGVVVVGESDAGGGVVEELVTGSPNASRLGESVPGFATTFVVAALLIAFIACVGVACGLVERYRATRPATWGEAIDVPDSVFVAVFDEYQADVIDAPGANKSRQRPKFENDARASVMVVAPTVSAEVVALAGDTVHASTFVFPAATTTVIPSAKARSTAELTDALNAPPRLRFMTAGVVV